VVVPQSKDGKGDNGMVEQLSWKVGGQQGEGIESTGEIFAKGLNRLGYYLYSYRHFSSRIKGGHTNNKVRVSIEPIRTISDDLDILVAFDQETIDLNYRELKDTGIILAEEKVQPKAPSDYKGSFLAIPFTKIASDLGNALMKNMAAIGATCAVMNLETDIFHSMIRSLFQRKGEEIVRKNMEALAAGFTWTKKLMDEMNMKGLKMAKGDGKKRLYLIGNEAIGMGALAAGARLMFAYPITPASDIMEYLVKRLPNFGGAVIQTEDEIAACTMAIGANYGGVRAFTASAGPGLSLMMEAIGLSGMTETPLVIVNTQRGGPSTGLPTKQEQSDLMAMIYGNHGEIPKVVIAPSTIEEAFYDTITAFNIAEEYQIPVILLSDLQLSLAKQTAEPFDYHKIEIRRGQLLDHLPKAEKRTYFKRYLLTDSGISPRTVPGTKDGIHHVTGVEHDETGRPLEGSANRKKQMEKRLSKLKDFSLQNPFHYSESREYPDLLMVGFNSTRGAIEEARSRLEREGLSVNHLHLRLLHPFPTDQVLPIIKRAKKLVVVEQNGTGQLAQLIKMHIGHTPPIQSILKYDGNPFLPREIYEEVKKGMEMYFSGKKS